MPDLDALSPLLHRVLVHLDTSIVVTDADGTICWVNERFTRLTGYAAHEAIGRRPGELLQGPGTDPATVRRMTEQLARGEGFRVDLLNYTKWGEPYWLDLKVEPILDETGRLTHFVGYQIDGTESHGPRASGDDRRSAAGRAPGPRRRVRVDALTGLPDRRLLLARLAERLDAEAGAGTVAVLLVGLQHCDRISDWLGAAAGNHLLQRAAARLCMLAGPAALPARVGPSEFALLLDGPADQARVQRFAQALVAGFELPFTVDGQAVRLATSVGAALHPAQGGSGAAALLDCADMAMRGARESGGARWQLFDDAMRSRQHRVLRMESRLSTALRDRALTLHWQPIVDAASHALVGAEALLRWDDAVLGSVPPSAFIPIAERCGLIGALGRWVLQAACRQARAWADADFALPISVNVSALQLAAPGFAGELADVLAQTGLPARLLVLELTESSLMQDPHAAASLLAQIRATGVRLAIDDFGTGYSSLAYLQRFPIHRLKIDRSFVAQAPSDPGSAQIAAAVVDIGRRLGMSVTAEGVETPAQARLMASLGCTELQGRHFGRPVSAKAFFARQARAGRDIGTEPPARTARRTRGTRISGIDDHAEPSPASAAGIG